MALTVLIVDDHEDFRRIARALLEVEGFEVIGEAADGVSAFRCRRGCDRGLYSLISTEPCGTAVASAGKSPANEAVRRSRKSTCK